MTAEDQNQSLHNNGDIYSKSLWELIQMMQISQRRLFACDCVEHVLHIYQEAFPDDTTVQEVIDLSRRFARGKAVYDELFTAKINLNGCGYFAFQVELKDSRGKPVRGEPLCLSTEIV